MSSDNTDGNLPPGVSVSSAKRLGRPRGPSDPTKSRQWQPKKWTPDYENVCNMYYVLGMKQDIIAERMNFSHMHVNNIVNSDKGKAYGQFIVERIREQTTGSHLDRLARLADQCLTNVEKVLSDPSVRQENPLGVVDRSMKFMEGYGLIKAKPEGGVTNNIGQQNNVFITDAKGAKELTSGLHRALEARKLYDAKKTEKLDACEEVIPSKVENG